MFVYLCLVLVCTAVASSGYGAPSYQAPSYSGPQYGGHHGGHHGGYHDHSDSSDSSSEEKHHHHHKKCRKLGELNVNPYKGNKAQFSSLETKGKNYVKISCPNDGKDYALLADQQGKTASANSGANFVNNTILLATGVNLDFVARCSGRRTTAIANNGDKVRIRDVSCVDLETAPPTAF
uniref:RNAse_Pc domain-containing protein n=1 Tax=Caenorhabditis tropicalis TaxID=1561998 RepID=A0A1I7T0G2_9PELO